MSVATTIHRGRPARPEVPSLSTRLKARLLRYRLERDLADAVPSWQTSLHAARALQITSRRQRRTIAKNLDRVIDDARHPRFGARTIVAPCRPSVLASAAVIEDLSEILHSEKPVNAMEVARLRRLLSDGIGPLYSDLRAGELRRQLQDLRAHLLMPD